MRIVSDKVIHGRVGVQAALPEDADVTRIALEGDETFEVSPQLEAIILESIVEGRRGEFIGADDLLRELRSRE